MMKLLRRCWPLAKPPGPRCAHRRLSGESFYQLHQTYYRRVEAERRWLDRLGMMAWLTAGLLLMLLWILLF